VESFEDAEKGINKSWVKGGVVNPEKGKDCYNFHLFSCPYELHDLSKHVVCWAGLTTEVDCAKQIYYVELNWVSLYLIRHL
jgi:hypothetical protein